MILAMVAEPLLAGIMRSDAPQHGNGGTPGNVSIDTMSFALPSDTDSLLYTDARRFDFYYLEAIRQHEAGNADSALALLQRCIDINPDAAEAYFLRSIYHANKDNDTMALRDIEKAAVLNPANDTYQETVAQYYLSANNYQQAIKAYEKLYEHHHSRTDLLSLLVQLYRHERDYDSMLRCIEKIEQIDGQNEELSLAKMNVYEMKGDKKMAHKTLKMLADEHPNDDVYKVMLGNWLMQNSRQAEGYKLFKAALDNDSTNDYALSSMYDYYRQAGKDSMAVRLRDKILLNPKTDARTKATMFNQVIRDNEQHGGDSTQVLALFDRAIASSPKDADIPGMKAAYMQLKNMPADSVNAVLYHILDIAPDNASARLQLLQSYWPRQDWDKIIEQSTKAIEYNPEEMAFYYFLGLGHYQKKDEDAALDAFRRGVSEINAKSNADMVSDFYAIMGDILHGKGLTEEAFAAYDSCLQWKDDNITCLNNYAYYLSVLDRDLQKAENMSYKAVKAEPDNGTYLDTYAWILFREKRFTEAQIYIDQALKGDTDSVQSPVIMEHAGDIYIMLGDAEHAVEFWQKAIERGGNKALLEKKIRLKKYIEEKK